MTRLVRWISPHAISPAVIYPPNFGDNEALWRSFGGTAYGLFAAKLP
jgi:hypothetical protein